ncbi:MULTISPECIES: cobalt-precorrin-6A reductase [Streptomyces]|uniref:cobalt-precorrin-6A reductase n=2 Tax=Streptomyces TaxID=1883 RepID=UPI00178C2B6F|nr:MULTISPECIES: cobalt-precorrin-6A reductase [Streptomyces]MCX4485790.1 cobalt-precorrin-6A reductase [Streptomyces anulatus]MCX4519459.1 cobalt-precorrin-6A reductase [Streptomyces anulatus]MCX4602340.1 cobalt-precorrin-6A reductase [Streptomyces anulatus]WSU74694.1 cobalt-precorrin-6A reductase [Streptomyces anulatus]WTD26942.1 cobalt-precorrin-6A reductase [Streptomyces anulatus]
MPVMPVHVLVLGGTTEARRLVEHLVAHDPGVRVTTSLAGRVSAPRLPPGDVRVGGFGGPDGLAAWVREHEVDALIDATHPFAATMSRNAAEAAAQAHVPLLALRRPGWVAQDGDRWHAAGSLAEAADLLPTLGERVFLTTGRMGLAAFAGAGLDDLWFLVRSVDAPEPPGPARMEVLLDRGPFDLQGERELIRRHRIDVLVTKDSGGDATAPKLTAAREAGIPVVVVRRPPVPEGVPVARTPDEAARWVRRIYASG